MPIRHGARSMPLTSLPVGSRRLVADSLPAFISRHRVGGETAAVWIAESERWFGVLAEIEGSSFPELEGLFEASRSRFEFLAIFGGPTPAVHQVLHVMRISFPTADSPCFFLEDLLRSGQTDWDEVEQDLATRGLCAQSFVSVESSMRVQPLSIAGSAALAAYAAVTERLDQLGGRVRRVGRFRDLGAIVGLRRGPTLAYPGR